ncbi:hypothetical protein [Rubrivirga sp. IMCC45206]|uniref:hypothetical protein n=1 Tax=Rubrivirga sp. IMCC45206 TaxID=3391614 RepID=UPI00398FD15E
MRLILALLASLAALSASAQHVPPPPLKAPPEARGARVWMTAGGLAGTAALLYTVSPDVFETRGLVVAIATVPVGAAVGVHGVAEALGVEGSLLRTLGRATAGAALGVGTVALAGSAESSPGVIAGVGILLVAPAVFAAAGRGRAEVRPAALRAAGGPTVAGLRVTVGL